MSIESRIEKTTPSPAVAVLALRGDVDTENALQLDEAVDRLLQQQDRLVIDLTQVRYVSSAGWRSFIARGSRGPQPGIKLAGMGPTVSEVFLLLGLDMVMNAYETVQEAVDAFGGREIVRETFGTDGPR